MSDPVKIETQIESADYVRGLSSGYKRRQMEESSEPPYFEMAGKMWSRCARCHNLVRLDKPIFGSLHICR